MSEMISILLTFSLILCNVRSELPTIRKTANGNVEGIEEISSMGQKYYAFRSVPYAEAPVTGRDPYTNEKVDRRFKPPEPLARTWKKNLQVQKFKNSCLESTQFFPTVQPTGEDCLYLNIYVPAGGAKSKTVLVWIHGGGFTEGGHREALYGPDFLLVEDNIVVAVQYRLGIFGFLNLGHEEYTGNMGLKDQRLALKWVYENIEHFSGNKKEILLFGESAGGASTTFHMLSKESRKYFTRAYAMSGSVYSYFALSTGDHVQKMEECAHTRDVQQIIEYIKQADVRDIIQCHFKNDWGKTLKPEWIPTIEGPGPFDGIQYIDTAWKSGAAPVMDTLFSIVSQEQVTFDMSLVTDSKPLINQNGKSTITLPFDNFHQKSRHTELEKAMKKLRYAYYSGASDLATISRENIALMSDLNFGDSVLKAVKHQADANQGKKNTFFFRFGVNDKLNWIKHVHKSKHSGAAHAEELCYIFHCHFLDKSGVYDKVFKDRDGVAFKTTRRMVKMITNFARNGNPSVEGDTPFVPIVSSDKIFCQEITNHPKSTVTSNIDQQLRYETWREIEEIYQGRYTVRFTDNGNVEGVEETSSVCKKYFAFRGVPYAEAPITGKDPCTHKQVDRRFKAPEPLARTWEKNLQVRDFKNSCLESTKLIPTVYPTGEDCLYLNIYVPAGGAEKKTVLVWIHGGGFTEGGHRDAFYGPDFLLAADNIVVDVQYRLGIFGFLNLGYGEYTGNMGLKDQQLALKWVYENIEHFSGNKSEILLFGESAGGASTTFHMLSEESRRHFQRAYVMSGSIYSYFALSPGGNHLKKMQKCHPKKTRDPKQIVEYIKHADYKDIVKCHFKDDWGKTLKPEWIPTIEAPNTLNAFITESPDAIWMPDKAPVLDAMFSFVSQEQVTFDPSLLTDPTPLIDENGESFVKLPFDYFDQYTNPREFQKAMKKLRDAYYSGASDLATVSRENIALMSDLNFGDSVLKAVKLQADANNGKKNTFFFRFGVNDKLNLMKHLHNSTHYSGAGHADELCYIFQCHLLDESGVYDEVFEDADGVARNTILRMVTMITNFARNGDPSIEGDTPFVPIVSSDKVVCQEITNAHKSNVTRDIDKQLRYDTWREVEQIYLVQSEDYKEDYADLDDSP